MRIDIDHVGNLNPLDFPLKPTKEVFTWIILCDQVRAVYKAEWEEGGG